MSPFREVPAQLRISRPLPPRSRVGSASSYSIERLEPRRLLSTSAINPNSAVPFQQIVIDPNPGTAPVVKLLADLNNDGKQDAIVGHEATLGGGGLDWYPFPASGKATDPWTEHVIDATADVYESMRAANISGHVDSQGNPVMDLVVSERGTIYWYENPLGDGLNPATATWTKHLVGSITQGATHELYLADLDGDGKLDIISSDAIFFQNSPTSWTRVANPTYNRTEKGLYLFDSGSGLGAIDLVGTGNSPGFQVGWYENPRDHGGNARTDTWLFHPVGPMYPNYNSNDAISYAAMDVDGDGREDIITCDGENNDTAPYLVGGLIWWQAPVDRINGTWTANTIDAGITDVHNIVLGDMNGDGQTDILAFEQDQSPLGRLMILYNEGGTGQNWLEQTLASDATVPGGYGGGQNESVGDADGDGALDILTSPHGVYSGVNPVSLWLNNTITDGIVRADVTTDPVSQVINAGNSVTFSVAATGTGPLVYQWEQNGLDIPGANSNTYTINSVPLADNGMAFRCIVSNGAGFIPSASATLGVTPGVTPTGVLTQPSPITTASASESLQVVYSAQNGILASTLMTGNLLVTGPQGFSQTPMFLGVTPSGNGQILTATYSVSPPSGGWKNSANGGYNVALVSNSVSDTLNNFAAGALLGNFTVNVPGVGSISGTQSVPASSYNLSTLGTADWAHWGRGGVYGNFDHESSGSSQISNVTVVGSGNYGGYTDASRAVTWTAGTPTSTGTNDHGYIWANNALGAGYSFTVPADTTPRTLYVYAGGYSSGATLTAHLSDNSAVDYTATASGNALYTNFYAITYHAGQPGQTLTITYTKTTTIAGAGGSIDLIAAALIVVPAPDTTPPTGAVTSAPTLVTAGSSAYTFTVTWQDDVAVKASSLGNQNLLVTGTGGYNQLATLLTTGLSNGASLVATYSIPAPAAGWTSAANGQFAVAVQPSQVSDTSGNFVAAGGIGMFSVTVPADNTPPQGSVTTAPPITAQTNAPYTFIVTWTDDVAVKGSTLGNQDLLVTSPGGFSQLATLVTTGLSDGTPLVATYSVPAPAGGWNNAANNTYMIALQPTQVSDTSNNFAASGNIGQFVVNVPVAPPGLLSGVQSTPASTNNLTSLGTADWAHWGRGGVYGNFDHKSSGASQISTVTAIGPGSYGGYTDASRSFTWSDGTPTATDTSDHGYIWANNALNAGFQFTVPADTTTRTLYIWAGGYSSGATLTAHLSDGSTGDYTATASGNAIYTQLYTITYHASLPNQTLTITYTRTTNINGTGGSADLIAAALVGPDTTLPTGSLTSAPTLTKAGAAPYTFNVTWQDNIAVNAGTIGNQDLLVTGPGGYSQLATLQTTSLSNGPTIAVTYSVPAPAGGWATSSNGKYAIAIQPNQVADMAGNFAAAGTLGSFSVAIPVPGSGSLTGTQSTPATSYNLTTLGTADWTHWGRGGVYGNFDHKSSGSSQISNVTVVGSGNYGGYTDPSRAVTWTGGTPTSTGTNDHGYIWANNALGAGYSFTVPADTTTRTLYVYAGGYYSGATLTAHLSDGSAADLSITASGTGLYTNFYAITYNAASAGQTLTITYTKTTTIVSAGGSIDLIAAALVVD